MSAEAAYKKVFGRPESLKEAYTHYCPGCGHSVAHRLVAECLDEMGLRETTIGVPPVGCAVLAYNYFNFDMIEAPHGRALAVATGIKRVRPESFVLSYQGDGDLAAIGTAETIHAANRGEEISTIFINNAIYGMTGGQMAPTTLVGMKTTTSPSGRDPGHRGAGYPIRVAELLATLEAPIYVARQSLLTAKDILKSKRAVKRAFELQKQGFTFVELVGTCPTNWGMAAVESRDWASAHMLPVFPVGVFRDRLAAQDGPAEKEG